MTRPSEPTPEPTTEPTRLRRGWLLVAALTFGLLATGCGSGVTADRASTDSVAEGTDPADDTTASPPAGDSGDSAEGGDGCDLISDDVAAEILGIEIVRREPSTDPTTGGVGCVKGTERVTDLTQASYVSIGVTPGGAPFLAEASREAGSIAVSGVGDQAVFLPSAGALFIADGADLVQTQVVHGGVPGGQEDCITAAEDVLGNR